MVGPLGRPAPEPSAIGVLADELGALIEAAQQEVAMVASAALTTLHWRIGQRIRSEILGARRGQFGAGIVVAIGAELGRRYGHGYREASLRQMIRFAEAYPDPAVVSELQRSLSWNHFKELMLVADPLRRGYYAAMKGELTPGLVFRESNMLDFLGVGSSGPDSSADDDLKRAVLREVERCLVGSRAGFSLVERRKRLGQDDRRAFDLLLFHRKLRRLVAVQIELGDGEPSANVELEFTLSWLDRHERQPGEQPSIGILLSAGHAGVGVEYLCVDGGVLAGTCREALPAPHLLQECIQRVLSGAHERPGVGQTHLGRTRPTSW